MSQTLGGKGNYRDCIHLNCNLPDASTVTAGYLWVSGLMLVVMLPLNILLRTFAVSISQLIASKREGELSSRDPVYLNGSHMLHALCAIYKCTKSKTKTLYNNSYFMFRCLQLLFKLQSAD